MMQKIVEQLSPAKKLLRRRFLMSVLSILLVVLTLYISYLSLIPFQAIAFKENEIQVVNDPVTKGEAVQLRFDYCKYTDIKPEIQVQLEDGIIVGIPWENPPKLEKGCHEVTLVGPDVPEKSEIFDGHPKRMRFILTYKVNGLRTITKEVVTEEFNFKP